MIYKEQVDYFYPKWDIVIFTRTVKKVPFMIRKMIKMEQTGRSNLQKTKSH